MAAPLTVSCCPTAAATASGADMTFKKLATSDQIIMFKFFIFQKIAVDAESNFMISHAIS
jgi:hypothetical protein